jgi:hypothetical protein
MNNDTQLFDYSQAKSWADIPTSKEIVTKLLDSLGYKGDEEAPPARGTGR